MKIYIRTIFTVLAIIGSGGWMARAQQLTIHDRDHNDLLVNDSVLFITSEDPETLILTASFALKNNTPDSLPVLMKRYIHQIPDSTIDFYCFSIQCWFGVDSVTIADVIPPYGTSYSFSTHVCHKRYLELATLPAGFSSINYYLYVPGTEIDATVTVNYLHTPTGIEDLQANSIKVFPNPAREYITLEAGNLPDGTAELALRDLLGRTVGVLACTISGGRATIPVSHLSNGTYFGQISDGHGRSRNFPFLVKH